MRRVPNKIPGVIWPKGSIVYICGISSVPFSPLQKDLGGSEQAVVQLSKCWASIGRQVVVFGNVDEGTYDGVEYRLMKYLNLADTFDTAIFWRSYGIRMLPVITAKKCILDLHDSWDPKEYVPEKYILSMSDAIMVKSDYHRSLYKYVPDSKIHVVMNGVQTTLFNTVIKHIPESARDPHRFIYASSYDRGLEQLLMYTWPRIKTAIPDATFDIYYGMNRIAKTPLGAKLRTLFKQPGVKEHGRVSLERIAKEKAKSAIHLYVSNCSTEIDCISVRESLLCGSVPVIGTDYVFKERDGIHVTGSTNSPTTYKKAATVVIDYMNHPEKLEAKRELLRKSDTVISWEEVAKKWLQYFA
jgi:glycosyltransferase involved in cell wall biosynthesis